MDESRYPSFVYVYGETANPLQDDLLCLVAGEASRLRELRDGRFTRSLDIEKLLLSNMQHLGFEHAVTERNSPGLFHGECDFEIDFFHPLYAIGVEVEKGKHFDLWRDVCKFSEATAIRHATLLIPYEKINSKGEREAVFNNTIDSLKNINRLFAGLESFFLIGY